MRKIKNLALILGIGAFSISGCSNPHDLVMQDKFQKLYLLVQTYPETVSGSHVATFEKDNEAYVWISEKKGG